MKDNEEITLTKRDAEIMEQLFEEVANSESTDQSWLRYRMEQNVERERVD